MTDTNAIALDDKYRLDRDRALVGGRQALVRSAGAWIMPVFKILTALRSLRESRVDLLGSSAERRLEVALRDSYLAVITRIAGTPSAGTLHEAAALARAPLDVRGFDPSSERNRQIRP